MAATEAAAGGECWASFLEHLSNDSEDDALNELMRLSNLVQRASTSSNAVLLGELQREAEHRFHLQLARKVQQVSKHTIAQIRDGQLAGFDAQFSLALRWLRLRVGLDVISSSNSDTSSSFTQDCLVPIRSMLVIQVTVKCAKARDDVRKQMDLMVKRNNASAGGTSAVSNREELGFIDAIETCVNSVLAGLALSRDHLRAICSSSNTHNQPFFADLDDQLCAAASGPVQQIVAWFREEREVDSRWRRRCKELGGLSLPRALAGNEPASTPPQAVRPLDDDESAMLDLVLHELSEILSLTHELSSSSSSSIGGVRVLAEEVDTALVSSMVRMDELWLTHNISKAVAHSEPISSAHMSVNSIVEDTFHIANRCVARAVHSHSALALEATANHVAGFISDGFYEILHQLVQRDSPRGGKSRHASSSSSRGALSPSPAAEDNDAGLGLGYAEAVNTLASCALFTEELVRDLESTAEARGGGLLVMARELLRDATARMQALLDSAVRALVSAVLLSRRALQEMDGFLCAAASPPYELKPGGGASTSSSWVASFCAWQFSGRHNPALRAAFARLSPPVLKLTVERMVEHVCGDWFEAKLSSSRRFNALGALQFDRDVRLMCELTIKELGALRREVGGEQGDAVEDDGSSFEIRHKFTRLRHWAHLVNLERARDEQDVPFPPMDGSLAAEEVASVLSLRTEPDYYY